jgi:hypothetical protein
LNKDLLRQLAKSGRGLFHFVADTEDIEKVFLTEVQSLVSPVASAPNLEIEYVGGLELAQVYGYEPQTSGNSIRIKLDNMNQGLTQVVLMRFRLARKRFSDSPPAVRVRLSYYDLERKRQVVKVEESSLSLRDGAAGGMLRDGEVRKNHTIALLAQAIREMAAAVESLRYDEAERVLTSAIAQTYQRYPHAEDEDISRTLMIAQKYQEVLRKHNQRRDLKIER